MGGWNLVYGLLNFAILAVALYFVGKKLVFKKFADRRDRVAEELEQSRKAVENAETLREQLKHMQEQTQKELETILTEVEAKAEENSRIAEEKEKKLLVDIAEETERETRQIRYTLRKELNKQAATDITGAAAEILAREEYFQARQVLVEQFITKLETDLRLTDADLAADGWRKFSCANCRKRALMRNDPRFI